MSNMLSFEGVSGGYEGKKVLQGLTFEVPKGLVYGVIGPNGCGKTTMLNAVTGLVRAEDGVIRLDGKDITHLPPDQRCHQGIGRTFQIPRAFSRMSVYENTLAAAVFGAGALKQEGERLARAALESTGLWSMRQMAAGTLSLMDRKRLEVARAVATRPRLLLLDEVAAGLTSAEAEEMADLIRGLREQGYTIIWIEHIVDMMIRVADHMMCMAEGRCAIHGSPQEVITSREVERLYLGVDGHE